MAKTVIVAVVVTVALVTDYKALSLPFIYISCSNVLMAVCAYYSLIISIALSVILMCPCTSLKKEAQVAEGQRDRAPASIGASWSGMQQQRNLHMGTTTMHVSAHVQVACCCCIPLQLVPSKAFSLSPWKSVRNDAEVGERCLSHTLRFDKCLYSQEA